MFVVLQAIQGWDSGVVIGRVVAWEVMLLVEVRWLYHCCPNNGDTTLNTGNFANDGLWDTGRVTEVTATAVTMAGQRRCRVVLGMWHKLT